MTIVGDIYVILGVRITAAAIAPHTPSIPGTPDQSAASDHTRLPRLPNRSPRSRGGCRSPDRPSGGEDRAPAFPRARAIERDTLFPFAVRSNAGPLESRFPKIEKFARLRRRYVGFPPPSAARYPL